MERSRCMEVNRRELMRLLGVGGAMVAGLLPLGTVWAQSRKDTLVIGIDISDTITLDPSRQAQYSPPMALCAAYDMLVSMEPGDYINLKPQLATAWARTPDGKGWRFTLREGVKFASGAIMTADDVKFSLDRCLYLGDQPSQYIANIERIDKVDAKTIDIVLKQPAEPILTILGAPACAIFEEKVVAANGGDASPKSKDLDKATNWLNQNSAGTGAYKLVRWERNAQIQLVANPNYWRGKPPFQRVVIRHIDDSAAQLLALRRGDVDAAFNLIPEQVATLKDDKDIWLDSLTSLDFVYMAVTQEPEFNKALAKKQARQAIGYAIDYDGIRDSMLGGAATRPVSFLPVGVNGSTEALTREIGFRQDLDRAKKLLAEVGLPDGFEFELAYGNAAIAGVSYQLLAQKIQADLDRVGIKAKLAPMDQVNLRTQYTTGKSTAVLTFWNPPVVENELWAAATVERVAKRVHWTPPDDLVKLVHQAAAESDLKKQAAMWVDYQKAMVDQANLIILFQPIYKIGVRKTIKEFPLTAAGWQLEMYGAKPG